ncbi:MAG TPA: dTDP-4-dehydrorhamnose reductase [Gemmatales bacterium]|nr:dTDP-4-dehydrorhamnose reductase [Gemmatales bacterium]HMP17616.1 dTDP-4-dehydrorhamnose reductase [Gemmatales bacterium]
MNTIVIGSHGQLGKEICSRLPEGSYYPATRQDIDLINIASIAPFIRQYSPELVINCAAYNRVDDAEKDVNTAFAVNAFGIGELAKACESVSAVLVHFSTDYVFGCDTHRTSPYCESDRPGPVSTYGISKLTGEYFVQAYCSKHYVLRTCGLYGKHGVGGKGGNFVETMLKLAQSGKTIRVVDDQRLTPSSASDVAEAALALIKECPYGLYHLTNSDHCSWYEFAKAIFAMKLLPADLQPISSKEYNSPALRPSYSVLISEHPAIPKLRPWHDALADYLNR